MARQHTTLIVFVTSFLLAALLALVALNKASKKLDPQIAAQLVFLKKPLDRFLIFSSGLTGQEQEAFRKDFVTQLTTFYGKPIGWKLALYAATPSTPLLGYTKPLLGQFLEQMILYGSTMHIKHNFATLPLYEVDFFVRVSNEEINQATTPEQFIENIDALYPAFELPDGFVSSFEKLEGPQKGGPSLLPLFNGLARLAVLAEEIPVPGSLTIPEWEKILSALSGEEIITTLEGTIKRSFNKVDLVAAGLLFIQVLKKHNYRAQKGDLISLGNVTGIHQFTGTEQTLVARYDTLIEAGFHGTVTLIMDDI